MLLMFIGLALFSALVMPPDLANSVRKLDRLFAPVAAPVRGIAETFDKRFSSNSEGRAADDRTSRELRDENEAIKVRLASLNAQLQEAERQLGEMGHLERDIRDLCRIFPVMGVPPGHRQMLSLEGSSMQGLTPQMPVVSPYGLVGRLDTVGLAEARVQLITDFSMSVQVSFRRVDANGSRPLGNLLCVAQGDGNGRMVINGLKAAECKAADLRVGDWAVLSDNADWPQVLQDYKVGLIEDIHDAKTPLFVDMTLRPYVDLLKVHDVMVLVKGK